MTSTMRLRKASQILADNVYRLRNDRGWSQSELAGRSNINQSRISQIESGKIGHSAAILDKLAKAFAVSQSELLAD